MRQNLMMVKVDKKAILINDDATLGGDYVFLKVLPSKGVKRFGVHGKISPKYGLFEVLDQLGLWHA